MQDWVRNMSVNPVITVRFIPLLYNFRANFAGSLMNIMPDYRIEKDTMGEVRVPADAYYGAQTQRSIDNFRIAQDINRMPKEIIRAFAYLKKAAAITNMEAGVLPKEKMDLISKVCDEILEGKLDESFPLVVWQTGSGTQS